MVLHLADPSKMSRICRIKNSFSILNHVINIHHFWFSESRQDKTSFINRTIDTKELFTTAALGRLAMWSILCAPLGQHHLCKDIYDCDFRFINKLFDGFNLEEVLHVRSSSGDFLSTLRT